ncbi:MAG: glutathione peroxidase, partial [Phycisphaerae bacterium]
VIALLALFTLGSVDLPAAFSQRPNTGMARRRDKKPEGPNEVVPPEYADVPPALRFKVRDIDGNEVELKTFHGDVLMIVNVASKCGYTPQYAELQQLHESYKDQGLVILAFPCNDFGEQEPGSPEDIKAFCADKYKVTFPLMGKVQVVDEISAEPFFKFLTDKKKNRYGGPIQWNFTKFLIDRKGAVRARFEPKVKPLNKRVVARLKSLLKVRAPKKKADESEEDASDGASEEKDDA